MICELCEGAIFQRWALALFVVLSRGGHPRYLLCYRAGYDYSKLKWHSAMAQRGGDHTDIEPPPPHTAWFYRKAKSGLEA